MFNDRESYPSIWLILTQYISIHPNTYSLLKRVAMKLMSRLRGGSAWTHREEFVRQRVHHQRQAGAAISSVKGGLWPANRPTNDEDYRVSLDMLGKLLQAVVKIRIFHIIPLFSGQRFFFKTGSKTWYLTNNIQNKWVLVLCLRESETFETSSWPTKPNSWWYFKSNESYMIYRYFMCRDFDFVLFDFLELCRDQ